MQVRATEVGYYGLQLKKVGDVFTLKDPKDFSGLWMEAVDKKDQKKFAVQDKQAYKDQLDAAASGLTPEGKPQPHGTEEPSEEAGKPADHEEEGVI